MKTGRGGKLPMTEQKRRAKALSVPAPEPPQHSTKVTVCASPAPACSDSGSEHCANAHIGPDGIPRFLPHERPLLIPFLKPHLRTAYEWHSTAGDCVSRLGSQ